MTGNARARREPATGGARRQAILPPHPISPAARQAVLDAAAALQVRRSEVAARVEAGPCAGAEVVAVGGEAIGTWLFEQGHGWSELLATRPSARVSDLRVSIPLNRYFIERGAKVVSLHDYDGLEPAARTLLANETLGSYPLGVCPVQMKIVNRELVILEGPMIDEQRSIMAVTAPSCLEATWRYWTAAVASVAPADPRRGTDSLTSRQQQIVGLLAADLSDEAIATALGVSVRTVRSDVATVLSSLGVRSRWAAAARLRDMEDR